MTQQSIRSMLAVFIAAFASLAAAGNTTGPNVGQVAPDFTLTDLASKKAVSLTQLRKKGYVLALFWSTRCHVCHAMLPAFKKTHKQYKDKNFTLAAINIGYENREQVEDYILQHDVDYLVLNDDSKKARLAQQYALKGTPTIKLIAPSGRIVWSGHRLPDLARWIK